MTPAEFADLVELIHAGRKAPGFILMLSAFFDDSGIDHENPRISIVGGYLASLGQAVKLQEEWERTFLRDGVKGFHMTDFETDNWPTSRYRWPSQRTKARFLGSEREFVRLVN